MTKYPLEDFRIWTTLSFLSNLEEYKKNNKSRLSAIIKKLKRNNWDSKRLFRNLDLSNADLSGSDLSNADLSGSDINNSEINQTNLSNTNFTGATAFAADFSDCEGPNVNMSGIDLFDGTFANCNFINANMRSAKLWDASITDSNFENTSFIGTDFVQHDTWEAHYGDGIEAASLQNVNCKKSDFSSSMLFKCSITNCDLSNTNFQRAFLTGANLEGCNLRGANLDSSDFFMVETKGISVNENTTTKNIVLYYTSAKETTLQEQLSKLDKKLLEIILRDNPIYQNII